MLKTLQVRNYVLIDSLDIEFPAGLVIITGQTGAGKSILLGAISLLLGAKADSSMVGESAENCVVEALFELPASPLQELFSEEDLDWNDGSVTVRRVLSRSGRSRAFVNDEPVSQALLARMSSYLMDIHSQHQTLMVTSGQHQLSLLDHFCGNPDLLARCSAAYSGLASVRKEIRGLREEKESLAAQREYDEARLAQLTAAALREGELEELESRQKTLANAEQIKSSLLSVDALMEPQEDEGRSLASLLKECERQLGHISAYLPEARTLAGRIESARLELSDVLDEVRGLGTGIEDSSESLARTEERMSLLYELLRRFNCRNEVELIAQRDVLSGRVHGGEDLDERISALERKEADLSSEYASLCAELHQRRSKRAPELAAEIQEMVRTLEMERAVFGISLESSAPGPAGTDAVTFLFSASGSKPVALANCASGGELSRIMLCLKAVMARYANMPSMIFDEIDTGVSGSVADKMGALICSMGEHMQVFAITHLPQVAVKGSAHFLVSKTISPDGSAKTAIDRLAGDDRVMEIARMLSGSAVSEAAIANARALMGKA